MTMMIVLIGLNLCFLGLFLWMQKKQEVTRSQMTDSFKALSFDVLEQSSKAFLNLANAQMEKFQEGAKAELQGRHKEIETVLEPVKTVMKQLHEEHRELEKRREGSYSALQKQIDMMLVSDREMRQETSQLVRALRSPNMRGSWGQLHLRRVVELAGLVNQCDFAEQVTHNSADTGKVLRPDLVVRLPGQRQIVVDSKTPLDAYLDAQETQDESRQKIRLDDHAAALRKHIKDLSSKEYWKNLDLSPEYVILFLPAEAFFSAALQSDPTLIELGATNNVIIATPTTLIAILRAVAFGWKQESLSKSAAEIAKLGAELYDRLGTVCEYWNKVGRQLGSAVESYNQSVASLESRVFVSAKKLKEYTGELKELPAPEQIEKLAKVLEREQGMAIK
jgi:DNA recombination protein RmuC